MRIVYLTHNINPKNGGGRYASDLISGVKTAGHDVVILKEALDDYPGIPLLARGLALPFSAIKSIKYLVNSDIVHALDVYPYGIIAWLANIFIRKKLIITAQGTYSIAPLYNFKTRWLAQRVLASAHVVIAISQFTAGELLKKAKPKKLVVINHGINFQNFYRPRQESNENFILSVGALKFRKGYHISIPAFALAKKQLPDLKYKIVGNQKDKTYFEKLRGIPGVEFLIDISDMELKELYSRAKLFILTSVNEGHHFEGFGLVFLEAAAAGLPVIGTLENGIEDAVGKVNGLLVPQGDIEKTAEALITVLGNHNMWQSMSEASYKWAKEHDISTIIQKYLSLYQSI